MPPWKDILSVTEAAERFGVSARTLRNWYHAGHVNGRQIGRDLALDAGSVERAAKNPPRPGRPAKPAAGER